MHKLAKQGTQVIVPYRDEDSKRHLKVMGDLGQIVPLVSDSRTNQARKAERNIGMRRRRAEYLVCIRPLVPRTLPSPSLDGR